MGSGVRKDAFANSGTASNLSNQLTSNAANTYGSLEPTLAAEAAHPAGFNPMQKSLMNTASQQSAGGQAAGALGAGKLYAARTNNAGGAKAAVGEGVRAAGGNLSKAALGTELADAGQAQSNQQRGISGLQSLNATELSGGETAMGLSNQALGIANQADANNPWMKILLQGMQSAGDVGAAYEGK